MPLGGVLRCLLQILHRTLVVPPALKMHRELGRVRAGLHSIARFLPRANAAMQPQAPALRRARGGAVTADARSRAGDQGGESGSSRPLWRSMRPRGWPTKA